MLFAVDQVRYVVAGQLEAVPVGDGIGGAGLDAVPAENAAVVINVIHRRVTLSGANSLFRGIFGGLDIDAVGRTGRRAQETSDAFLQTLLVALQHVQAAEALAEIGRLVGIILRYRGAAQMPDGNFETLR